MFAVGYNNCNDFSFSCNSFVDFKSRTSRNSVEIFNEFNDLT